MRIFLCDSYSILCEQGDDKMQTIEIDTDVFTFLQKNARPFVDTPNSTLRRLLCLDDTERQPSESSKSNFDLSLDALLGVPTTAVGRRKAPKANLQLLVEKRALQSGQELYFVDYQGNRMRDISATISGADLVYDGKRYSMSKLAQHLLAQEGFDSKNVRGPAHWVTDDNKSVKELWRQYLDSQLGK